MEDFNKHYITVDGNGCIVDGFSDAFRTSAETDICINEDGGYQFRLFPGGEENPFLYAYDHMIPLYKYEDGEVKKRTQEEIDADIAALPVAEDVPTEEEDTAAMLIDHEFRLTMLELGLSEY